MAADGLITIPSSGTVEAMLDRLEREVKARGIAVFARIDHAAGAASAGLAMRPTELLIFGNATAGTPLMQATQTIGIDLPLKALAWEDALGRVWLSYNDPGWLAHRHGLDACVRHRDRCHDRDAREHRAKRRGRAVPRGVAGRGRRGRLSPCHRHLIPCSIDLTRCSTDLIPCSVA